MLLLLLVPMFFLFFSSLPPFLFYGIYYIIQFIHLLNCCIVLYYALPYLSTVGPFIRLLDDSFTLEDLRNCNISLSIYGSPPSQFILQPTTSSLKEISRDITELVDQTINSHHQYPDGFFLFTGTMFAPTQDRDPIHRPKEGFTHEEGDIVAISSQPQLGCLVNIVEWTDCIEPWSLGIGLLMDNLNRRDLL